MTIQITPHPQFPKESPWYRRYRYSKGAATADLLWLLVGLTVLGNLWYSTGGPERPAATAGPFLRPPAPLDSGEIYSPTTRAGGGNTSVRPGATDPTRSPWFELVKISSGNARQEYRPGHEYIELTASSRLEAPINLAGWQLTNGAIRRPRSDVAVISEAVTLAPGARAVVITGQPLNRSGWPFRQSFRLNKCVGYLNEQFETSGITPTFSRRCPDPEAELGASALPDKCYDFVRRLSSCHQPEFSEDREGNDLVDGREDDLNRQCRLYVEDHFSYDRCVAWHQTDADFYGDDWRVYLKRQWELWDEDREVMTLYDQNGKIVDQLDY